MSKNRFQTQKSKINHKKHQLPTPKIIFQQTFKKFPTDFQPNQVFQSVLHLAHIAGQ